MRRKDREIVDIEQIEEVIRQSTVCFLALCDEVQPYVIPLSFGYERRVLYFHSAPEGRKLDLIRRNPRVGFAIATDHEIIRAAKPCNWGLRYRSVTGQGLAEIVHDSSEKRFALDRIMAHYAAPDGDYEQMADTCVIRVTITQMTGKRSG